MLPIRILTRQANKRLPLITRTRLFPSATISASVLGSNKLPSRTFAACSQWRQEQTNSDGKSNTAQLRMDKPSYQLTFTCKKCDTRSSHNLSKQAYHHGTVLIQCPGCKNRHLIADHLKIFSDKGITLEDILASKGEGVTKGTIDPSQLSDQDMEWEEVPAELQKKIHAAKDEERTFIFSSTNLLHELLMRQSLTIPHAHNGSIHVLTYSTSGNYVLSGGQDRLVHLWNINTGAKINSYLLHRYEVLDISLSADDTRFASVGGDRTAYLWDTRSGNTLARFSGHTSRINSCDFDDSASVLATASFDKSVRLWDCRSLATKPVQVLDDATDGISSVAFSGDQIISGSVDGLVRIYDIRMGQLKSMTMAHPVTSVQRSGCGGTVLVSTLDDTVRLMDEETGKMLQSFKGHRNRELRIRSKFAKHDEFVVSSSEDNALFVWDFSSGHIVHRLSTSSEPSYRSNSSHAFATHPYEFIIASSVKDSICVWK